MKKTLEHYDIFRENTRKIAEFFGVKELYLLHSSNSPRIPDLPEGFPSQTTLHKFVKQEGATPPTAKTVAAIADFCNKTFEFTIPVTAEDLVSRPLGELRRSAAYRLRPENRQWLSGTFYCYYYERDYTEEPEEGLLVLRGALLKVEKESSQGLRSARLVVGFNSDDLMRQAAREIFGGEDGKQSYERYRVFRKQLSEEEKSLYFFEGTMRDDASVVTAELKKRIQTTQIGRKEERISLFIHGHPVSIHESYQGGLALALRFILEDKTFLSFRFGISAKPLNWSAPQLGAMLMPKGADSLSVEHRTDKIWYHFSIKNPTE